MITARMAPVWIAMSKTLAFSSSNPSSAPARIRWPVLEIGRNSVRPSTTPMIAALTSRTISTRDPFAEQSADYRVLSRAVRPHGPFGPVKRRIGVHLQPQGPLDDAALARQG